MLTVEHGLFLGLACVLLMSGVKITLSHYTTWSLQEIAMFQSQQLVQIQPVPENSARPCALIKSPLQLFCKFDQQS